MWTNGLLDKTYHLLDKAWINMRNSKINIWFTALFYATQLGDKANLNDGKDIL